MINGAIPLGPSLIRWFLVRAQVPEPTKQENDMAKTKQVNENWNVSYSARERNSNEDIKCVSMNWENRSAEEVMENLNTWLVACGYQLKVVQA